MIIREIELNNFRIYKGVNKIVLSPDGERNIIVVSGNNGFGKTTFLMSLVWCLYGKQMEKVDELYRKEIVEKGGYSKYIGNSLNFEAKKEGKTRFSVSVTFTDVEIPDTPCTDITITRSYDSATNSDDELEIFIDGRKNDLFSGTKKEITEEEEIFIRDYILPIEIAKFFFFDAEKIVSFAQINTPTQRQDLSRAYSQVLGIQKYDDLMGELERIQDDYRRESARPQERKELNDLIADINNKEYEIRGLQDGISELENDKVVKEYEQKNLQERLIREGDTMTKTELEKFNERREILMKEQKETETSLKDLYNLLPFGLAGGLVSSIADQLKEEKAYKQNKHQLEGVKEKTNSILSDIEKEKQKLHYVIDINVRDFYEGQIRKQIKKHFYSNIDESRFDNFSMLHDFTPIQEDEFTNLMSKIKDSKSSFDELFNKFQKAKAELFSIERKIRDTEKKAESDYVQELRRRKENLDNEIMSIFQQIAEKKQKIENLNAEITAHKKQKEILSKKIAVSEKNKAVDEEASKLIHTIQRFLIRFKEEKKKSLANRLEEKLKRYLHKTNLVSHVAVDINGNGDDVDISLLDAEMRKIDKSILSMGEKQMFASALLSALVDETGIEFPVFIDSPMQKFDTSHTRNILTQFYPNVSKQVVLFPLLKKELTEDEYSLISPIVSKSYLIANDKSGSNFIEVEPNNLFTEYNNRNYAD